MLARILSLIVVLIAMDTLSAFFPGTADWLAVNSDYVFALAAAFIVYPWVIRMMDLE